LLVETKNGKLNVMHLACKGVKQSDSPLIMIHGLAANMAFWLQVYAHHFTNYFDVILYDLRGHGRSSMSSTGYTPDDMMEDLQAVMFAFNMDSAHVIAHSFGGIGALKLALSDSEKVKSLILAETHISLGRKLQKQDGWGVELQIQEALKSAGITLDTRDEHFGYKLISEVARLKCGNHSIPETLNPWIKHIFGGKNPKSAQKWVELVDNSNAELDFSVNDNITENDLKNLLMPILAVYGAKSQAQKTGFLLKDVVPIIDFHLIEDAGHFFPKAQHTKLIYFCENFWCKFLPNFNLFTRKESAVA
jgi:pimeloyl-ACP methyl ester carboxylesterase